MTLLTFIYYQGDKIEISITSNPELNTYLIRSSDPLFKRLTKFDSYVIRYYQKEFEFSYLGQKQENSQEQEIIFDLLINKIKQLFPNENNDF